MGCFNESVTELEEALRIAINYRKPDHGMVAIIESVLCSIYHYLGDITKCKELGKKVVQKAKKMHDKEPKNAGILCMKHIAN